MREVQCVWQAEAILGEALFWDANERVLYWVDISGKAVLRWDPATGGRDTYQFDREIGCIVPRSGGGFIAGVDDGLAYLDRELTRLDIFASPEASNDDTRFNDGKCDPRGRFWVGSTDKNETEPFGALYRINGEGRVEQVLSDIIVSNGLGWSPDCKTMYFTDSGMATIYRFDFDIETGAIDGKRNFVVVDQEDGMPDGLAVDSEGFVWSAHWNGWRVTRYDPDGRVDKVLDLPVPHVTSLAFGGDVLNLLYMTTARLGLSASELQEAPLSGGLFVADVGVAGMSVDTYSG